MIEVEIMKADEPNVHGALYTSKAIIEAFQAFHYQSARPIVKKTRDGSDHELAFVKKEDFTFDPVTKILRVKIPDNVAKNFGGSYVSPVILVDKEATIMSPVPGTREVKGTKVIDGFRLKSIQLSEEGNAFKGIDARLPVIT